MNPTRKKTLSEPEFRAFCNLLMNEEGKNLDFLSQEFSRMIEQEPQWKEFIHSDSVLCLHPKMMQLLEETRANILERSIAKLLDQGENSMDLEEALFLLTSYCDSPIDRQKITLPLDEMGKELEYLVAGAAETEKVISIFSNYIFQKKGFHGNTYNYYDPDNSYLSKVLERKAGIPISLSCVCLLLAKRVRWRGEPLPLSGIGLPSHFLLQFRFPEHVSFFDAFNQGRTITRKDCIEILRKQDIQFKETYLYPVNSYAIACRTVTNLLHIYSNLGEEGKKNQLLRYLQILNGEETPA